MKRSRAPTSLILAGLLAFVLSLAGLSAHAAEGEMSKESKACLSCHDKDGITKTLESGEALSLACLLYTSPSPRDGLLSRMPSSA